MAKDKKPRDYLVGRGKPPQHTKFVQGQSGNPNGRPKGSKNFKTEALEELNSKVSITENGKRRKITKRRAFLKQVANKGAAGELKAMPILLSVIDAVEGGSEPGAGEEAVFHQEEALVLDSIIKRIRETMPDPPSTDDAGPKSPIEEPPKGDDQ
jgi:hypothetical protein